MSSFQSTSVMQMFQIIFISHECALDKQQPECDVLDRGIMMTSFWPICQILKIHSGISVFIKNALLMFLYRQLHTK